ncbi:hypothetical protein MNBD_ALPHA09-1062 [hydrothermal vent metagenome]|uniref:Restriction endonuclease BglII n=1 Tax=hydrothermal vent metagenome TaxID=652676 RepID=A0A3B0TA62_9ZZZZ
MIWADHIPSEVSKKYEVIDHRHAAAILNTEFHDLFQELMAALIEFELTDHDVLVPGGSESPIPKKISSILRPLGWTESKLTAKLVVDDSEVSQDTHKVDYIKGRVAFDLEWNSKDQTFDRDLFAFRSFFEFDRISVGVLLTRSTGLQSTFKELGIAKKYGASTTHMNKLIPRLNAGRAGGCPVLALGISEIKMGEKING